MISVIRNILGYFSSDLAIDLGTANTLVYVKNKGIVIREPSIVAQHKRTKIVMAIGTEAKKMVGRAPANIEVIRPLREGVISDYDTTEAMLSYFIKKVHTRPGKRMTIAHPRVVIGVPTQISEVQRRAVIDAAKSAGARSVFLIEEPIAAAFGSGLSINEPVGSMIVDIGGGTCEIAVVSLGGIVSGRSLKTAGDAMDMDIISYIRSRWALAIGEKTAEEIKILLGNAYVGSVDKQMVVRGRDLEKGLPKSIRVNASQIREALLPSFNKIVEAVNDVIEDTPPELSSDIAERGIVLCGGGSLIPGLLKLVSNETKMPVSVASEPLSSVVLGCAKLLGDQQLLARVKIMSSTS